MRRLLTRSLATGFVVLLAQTAAAQSVPSPPTALTPPVSRQPAAPQFVHPPPTPSRTPRVDWTPVELPEAARPRRQVGARPRWELIAPGIVSLVGGYIGWIGTAISWNLANTHCSRASGTYSFFPTCTRTRGTSGDDILFSLIPLAGPWISAGTSDSLRGFDYLVPALVGLLQATGVVLIAVGVATRGAQVEVSANATGLRVSGHFD